MGGPEGWNQTEDETRQERNQGREHEAAVSRWILEKLTAPSPSSRWLGVALTGLMVGGP